MKNKILIRICGKEYAIVGQESDEYIQRVSLYIDKKMNEITKSNTKLSTAQAAVLTSINVADDYFKTLEAYTTVEDEFSRINIEYDRIKRERDDLKKDIEKNMERIKALEIKTACLETELKGKS
jgi:cell division protein ZapA